MPCERPEPFAVTVTVPPETDVVSHPAPLRTVAVAPTVELAGTPVSWMVWTEGTGPFNACANVSEVGAADTAAEATVKVTGIVRDGMLVEVLEIAIAP